MLRSCSVLSSAVRLTWYQFTSYRAQVLRYREVYRRLNLNYLTVATTDASQGLEIDCVVFDSIIFAFRTS